MIDRQDEELLRRIVREEVTEVIRKEAGAHRPPDVPAEVLEDDEPVNEALQAEVERLVAELRAKVDERCLCGHVPKTHPAGGACRGKRCSCNAYRPRRKA